MFLKSLEIRGFKSFADKTELKFKKGVTAVVGPNGSGKSNISDAVRWVLGEQSIKVLRGGKMEDVIFAGTQFRKPVGLAQVSLTLDNSDESLSTEYNEVTVSRRIFRSGESEYLINNSKCRLKDVTNLFMDTGIGKEGYSLIGQGKIEAILSGKPEERRSLLEEAAGIVKFKNRKEEAEKKLSNTDDNLVRINDILSTYEERIEPLRIEREKALEFNELSQNLKVKEVSLIVHTIKNMEEELKTFNEDLNLKIKDIEDARKEIANDKEMLRVLEGKIEEIEKKTLEEKEQYYNLKEIVSDDTKSIELYHERIKSFEEKINRNNYEISDISIKIQEVNKNKAILEEELVSRLEAQKLKNEDISKLEEYNRNNSKELKSMEEELKNLKEGEFELLRNNSDIKNEITILNKDIALRDEKTETLNSSISSLENNIVINLATYKGLSNDIEVKKDNIKLLNLSIVDDKKNISVLSGNLTRKENELRELNSILTKLDANKNMLENLEKHYEGYNRSVKTLMESIHREKIAQASDTKVLGEVFTVSKEYEIAIEIALGAAISNVITKNEEIAKILIGYLKKNSLGRATFLPLNIIKGKKLVLDKRITEAEGYVGLGSDIISYDIEYENIMNYTLGRTIICTNMDCALNIARRGNFGYKIVTLEGEVINPGGALTGGSIKGKNTNVLGRKREIEELENDINKKKQTYQELIEVVQDLKVQIKKINEDVLNKRDEVHEKNIELTKKESESQRLQNDTDKLRRNLKITKEDLERIINEKEVIFEKLKVKEEEIKSLENENSFNKNKSLELEKVISAKLQEVNSNENKLTEMKINKATLDEAIEGKKNEFSRMEKEIQDLSSKSKLLTQENIDNQNNIETLNLNIKEKHRIIEKNTNSISVLESNFKDEEILKEKLKQEFKEKDNLISGVLDEIGMKEMEVNKREVIKAKKETEKEHIYKKLNDELELTYAEALDICEPVIEESNLKQEIYIIKGRITKLGVVNLAAIEEYEDIKEKYEFMSTQAEDLENAKKELISVIEEMTNEMKNLFIENFKILNYNFNQTFKDLFKGGSAELILGEGDELTANIDINVEPPGKKLQNINLMSGGEKVLSAIALLFAILKMKPTPFCILDEIEAALDDANVYRYAEFLTRFSQNTQFIVITHRKGTMEASDIIYGVTMEEKGISKVVSVDLTKN
ncbi:chromosome segregation protein SMC [Clostridium saccharobutylicum]|uniref:Chromosome partition protein Smc n=1 Tax=Clostridium saccharobutylicum DSM 13864 TaxID=1345695 RepID=U5MRZ4_CLOSA|nr:chromosome segregation protein SMC [Clostridium saccharobutylicum]AGX42396.1 chromosome partition protein Smc [Clostridium saccharobutylicum DSM 13864]AQR89678.1 chromosome partition protein Smc [Clostridium saccharobutylicum]AQR99580.1 chromosome partition protein Smc [Clostridium saccharobutylicum]AQS13566.1 chromosome partition protein Smc [Clostridium saccharobutylicum]MBA2904244.1 chromosome segregation protein [Clostridium saccharobutylicum]